MLISIMPATALAANKSRERELKRIVVTIKKPKAGDSLYYEAKVPARANYTAKIRWWLEYSSLNTGREMNDNEKFVANKTYLAQVEVTPKAGFHISREALVTVNGESAGRVSEDALTNSKDYRWEYLVPDGPYTVSYNSNGAAGHMEAAADVYELTLPECDFTAPAGKFFGGWLVDGMDGAKWFPGDTIKIKKDTTLYALWTPGDAGYTVTYRSIFDDSLVKKVSGVLGVYELIECPWEMPGGVHYFDGWTVYFSKDNLNRKDVAAGDTINVTSDVTIYDNWAEKEFKRVESVTFNANLSKDYKLGIKANDIKISVDENEPYSLVEGGYGKGYYIDDPSSSDVLSTSKKHRLYVNFKMDDGYVLGTDTIKLKSANRLLDGLTGDYGNIKAENNIITIRFDLPDIPAIAIGSNDITFTLGNYEADKSVANINVGVETLCVSLNGSGYGQAYSIYKNDLHYASELPDGSYMFKNFTDYFVSINFKPDEGYKLPDSYFNHNELILSKFKLKGVSGAEVVSAKQTYNGYNVIFKLPRLGKTVPIGKVSITLKGYQKGKKVSQSTVTASDNVDLGVNEYGIRYFYYTGDMYSAAIIPDHVLDSESDYKFTFRLVAKEGYDTSKLTKEDITLTTPVGVCTAILCEKDTYGNYFVGFDLPPFSSYYKSGDINKVEANYNVTASMGAKALRELTLNSPKGQGVSITDVTLQKSIGGGFWEDYTNDTFEEGTYRLSVILRSDSVSKNTTH